MFFVNLKDHNRIHAADVLHACHYLTTQSIPYFVNTTIDSKKLNHHTRTTRNRNNILINNINDTYGCLGTNFLSIELLALYCSAAMHDYDHPGRNNLFLIQTQSPLALLYNDKSILENHHAASSWQLLKSNEKFNFLCNLDSSEWKRLRFLIIENILSTDLTKHASILDEFKTKTITPSNSDSYSLDWQKDDDRLLVSQVIIKIADISGPLKEKQLHVEWTDRLMKEFYDQGDEEKQLGLPISDFMDRTKPSVPKLQVLFMKNLLNSLCNAYSQAGFMPGIIIADNTYDGSSCSDDELDSNDFNTNSKFNNRTRNIVYSELISNFNANLEMWIELVKKES